MTSILKEDNKNNIIRMKKMNPYMMVKCDQCLKNSFTPAKEIHMDCKRCGKKNVRATIISEEALTAYLPIIMRELRHKNEIIIESNDKHIKDFQYIKEYFKGANFALEFEEETKIIPSAMVKCTLCGVCQNCVTCKCGNKYLSSISKCPECKSRTTNAEKTVFKNAIYKKHNIPECPECGAGPLQFTYYKKELEKCPECGNNERKIIPKMNSHVFKIRRMGIIKVEEQIDNG